MVSGRFYWLQLLLSRETYHRRHSSKKLLIASFPRIYVADIEKRYSHHHKGFLFPTYIELWKATTRDDEEAKAHYRVKKSAKKGPSPDTLFDPIKVDGQKLAVSEYKAAVAACREVENTELARTRGEMGECGCCYDEFPLNRMISCDGEDPHLFCRGCTRQMAETQIGFSKYELRCMSLDSCSAGFSRDQRALFLDKRLITALDRIEQETVLRLAGIVDLETCPFCPYAAEYPPVESNKEFRCENPKCGIVSCRLCREETHIPKTCEEAMRDVGHSARHKIEEAMSEALIRKCNKCMSSIGQTPTFANDRQAAQSSSRSRVATR